MATHPAGVEDREIEYPTSDGKPMAETEVHLDVMMELILTLREWYADDPNVYVNGNMLLYYEKGNPRKYVSPDVQVTLDIPKRPPRELYKTWVEGKPPDVVIEVTSKSTRHEDMLDKFELYRDTLKVAEYFLFDPNGDYLAPPIQGYRLVNGEYVEIEPVDNRVPSELLKLHLGRAGTHPRLYDPSRGELLPTPQEARRAAERLQKQAEEQLRREAEARQRAEAELERMRQELEALRKAHPEQEGA